MKQIASASVGEHMVKLFIRVDGDFVVTNKPKKSRSDETEEFDFKLYPIAIAKYQSLCLRALEMVGFRQFAGYK